MGESPPSLRRSSLHHADDDDEDIPITSLFLFLTPNDDDPYPDATPLDGEDNVSFSTQSLMDDLESASSPNSDSFSGSSGSDSGDEDDQQLPEEYWFLSAENSKLKPPPWESIQIGAGHYWRNPEGALLHHLRYIIERFPRSRITDQWKDELETKDPREWAMLIYNHLTPEVRTVLFRVRKEGAEMTVQSQRIFAKRLDRHFCRPLSYMIKGL